MLKMKFVILLVAFIALVEIVNSQRIDPLRECKFPRTKCVPRSQCSKGFQDGINNGSSDVVYLIMAASYCGFQYEPLHCCETDCITPNGDNGLCKPLTECQYFNNTSLELDFLALSVKACNGQSQSPVGDDEDARRNERALICCSDKQDIQTRKVNSPFTTTVRIIDDEDVDDNGNSIKNGESESDPNRDDFDGQKVSENIEPRFRS